MLRNLLYSIFFHIFFFTFLLMSSANIEKPITYNNNVTSTIIGFISKESLKDVKKHKTSKVDPRVEDLTLDEKIELYEKIRKRKIFEDIKNNASLINDKNKEKVSTKIGNFDIDNEFSYYYTPIYVAENKVSNEEKLRIIENHLKKEELRKKLRERGVIPEPNENFILQFQVANSTSSNEENNQTKLDLDKLADEISFSNIEIDEKYADLREDKIFSEEDYKNLLQINSSKINTNNILTLREKRNIQKQIKDCYKMAIIKSGKDSKSVVRVTVKLNNNGSVILSSLRVSNMESTTSFDIALDNAKSALVFCSPLKGLPQNKYQFWRHLSFVFDSSNLE